VSALDLSGTIVATPDFVNPDGSVVATAPRVILRIRVSAEVPRERMESLCRFWPGKRARLDTIFLRQRPWAVLEES
jgi:hypothetical protein